MSWVLAVCDRTGRLVEPLRETAEALYEDVEVLRIPDGPALEKDGT